MTKVKFVHAADLHLDTPFRGLSSLDNELAGKLKDATFESFGRIINLCITEKADFLLLSGDIFDGEKKSLSAQLKLVSGLHGLAEKGIPTYLICGNHDPLDSWMKELEMPENVFRFGSSKVDMFTYRKDGQPLADVYGISYRTKHESRDLAGKFKLKNNPAPVSIALLHGTVGNPGPHENYAPFKPGDIVNKGFDYWALGHIHKRQIIRKSDPAIVYPGNPQGRDFGETGARGCCIVEITSGGSPEISFVPTQTVRFEELEIDLSGEEKINRLTTIIAEAKNGIADYDEESYYILRINLKGRTPLHDKLNSPGETDGLVETFNDDYEGNTRIDRIVVKTQPDIDIERVREGNDFPAEVLKLLEQTKDLKGLFNEIDEESKMTPAIKKLVSLGENDPEEIMEKAKWMLLDQLVNKE